MSAISFVSQHHTQDLKQGEESLISIAFSYPQTQDPDLFPGLNNCLEQWAQTLIALYTELILPEAKMAQALMPDALPYQISADYTITYNDGKLFSAYTDLFLFAGGVRGVTYRFGQTVQLEGPKPIFLSGLFPKGADLSKIIPAQAAKHYGKSPAENKLILFSDYFSPENFYLAPEGLHIFYQSHTVAPPAAGIFSFLLPFSPDGPHLP